jgi:hypothetical protein
VIHRRTDNSVQDLNLRASRTRLCVQVRWSCGLWVLVYARFKRSAFRNKDRGYLWIRLF